MKQIRKGKMVYEGFEFAITAVYDEADEWLPAWDADAELAVVGNPVPRIDGAQRVVRRRPLHRRRPAAADAARGGAALAGRQRHASSGSTSRPRGARPACAR